ncbi:MAG: type VI secretion system-associated protein TagF [Granulosicoccus sp.]
MNQLGYFGKTRHRGDFVRFNLPQSFTKVWDDWLQQIILDGEQYYQQEWKSLYDNAPAHHFVLSSGIAGNQVWVGILLPSQDKVGRRFPFCLAMSLTEFNLPLVSAAQLAPWFKDAHELLVRMQGGDFDFDLLQVELASLAEKYAQDAPATSPLITMPNLHSDSIGIAVNTADPLDNAVATQALLDAALIQTLGEYSLWMCQDGSKQSLLHSGLPVGQSALAMFSGDSQACAPTQLDISSFDASAFTAAAVLQQLPENENDAMDETSEFIQANSSPENPDYGLNESEHLDSNNDQVIDNNDIQALDTGALEQAPSADDWAALDEFDEAADVPVTLRMPKVEPLELDDDDSIDTEDAPWET